MADKKLYDGGALLVTVPHGTRSNRSRFQELGARTLYLVHNSTFDLAFHPWRDPLDRVADLAEQSALELATPAIGEVLTLGQSRTNERWWKDLR